jgi:hypothetical protein
VFSLFLLSFFFFAMKRPTLGFICAFAGGFNID